MTNAFQQPWGMGSLRADIGSEDYELESMLNSGGSDGYATQTGGYAGGAAAALLNPNGSTAQRLVMAAPQIAGATITGAAAFGSTWATAAIPIVGPIIAGVTIGLTLLFARKGPRQKVATTAIVDKVEPLLKENVQGYLNGNRSRQSYEQAVENFNAGWQFVVEHCGIPEMGNPGQNCITERQRGGRWDWFKLYLDPILENAPAPVTASIDSVTSGISDSFSRIFGSVSTPGSVGGGLPPFAVIAAGAALLYVLFSSSRGQQ